MTDKRILLPTDFSENARNAIEYALQLYKDEACTFFLMNSYTPPLTGVATSVASSGPTKLMLEVAKKNSEEGLKKVLQHTEGNATPTLHRFKTLSKYDFFLSAVKEVITEESIDLIVMGTKGASGLKEIIMGSNTASVIGKVECPVLAVPEKATFKGIREIAFATDYERCYDPEEMAPLYHIAEKHKAIVSVLHAQGGEALSAAQEAVKNDLRKSLSRFQPDFHTLTDVELETAIRLFIQSRPVDMLCMIDKPHNFFERFLGKPKVEEISFHIKIPFLVLHEKERE